MVEVGKKSEPRKRNIVGWGIVERFYTEECAAVRLLLRICRPSPGARKNFFCLPGKQSPVGPDDPTPSLRFVSHFFGNFPGTTVCREKATTVIRPEPLSERYRSDLHPKLLFNDKAEQFRRGGASRGPLPRSGAI